jgi:hypothetical protein
VISGCSYVDQALSGWWVDSGVTCHIAMSKEGMVDMIEYKPGEHRVYIGNTYYDVMGVGTYHIETSRNNVLLSNVLFVSSMRHNLVFVLAFVAKGFEVRFLSRNVNMEKHG